MSALADADEFVVELIEDVLPDLIQAHSDLTHHDAPALIERARTKIRDTYLADTDSLDFDDPKRYREDSAMAAEVVMQTLNAVAMAHVWASKRERTPAS